MNIFPRFKKAFSLPTPPPDELVSNAIAILRSREADQTGMGFHKLKNVAEEIVGAKQFLDEHGVSLQDDQLDKLIKYMKELEEHKRAKTRFWIQIALSIILIGGSIGILLLGTPTPAVSNSLFALLGLIVGYWFPSQGD